MSDIDYEAEFLLSIPSFLRRLEAPGRGPRPSERGPQPTGQRPAGSSGASPRQAPKIRRQHSANAGIAPAPAPNPPPTQARMPPKEVREAATAALAAIEDPAIVSIKDHRPASMRNLGPAQTEPAAIKAGASSPPPAPAPAPADLGAAQFGRSWEDLLHAAVGGAFGNNQHPIADHQTAAAQQPAADDALPFPRVPPHEAALRVGRQHPTRLSRPGRFHAHRCPGSGRTPPGRPAGRDCISPLVRQV